VNGYPPGLRETIKRIKAAFVDAGGATLEELEPELTWNRNQAAQLIRKERRNGARGRAISLRDAWRELLAICEIDGGLTPEDATRVALHELQGGS
jgi:hypothetical protein